GGLARGGGWLPDTSPSGACVRHPSPLKSAPRGGGGRARGAGGGGRGGGAEPPATSGVIPPQPDAGMARKWERSTPPRAWTSGDRNWCATLFPWNGATSGRRRFHACIGLDRRRFLQASSSPARLRKLAGTQEGRSRRD